MILYSLAEPIKYIDVACSTSQVQIYQIFMVSDDADAYFIVVGRVIED